MANGECYIPDLNRKQQLTSSCVWSASPDAGSCFPACSSLGDAVCPEHSVCTKFSGGAYGYCAPVNECQACNTTADCAPRHFCGARSCDGVRGCYIANGSCSTIGGIASPPVCNFGACPNGNGCGTKSRCLGYPDAGYRCLQACAVASECAAPESNWGTNEPACVTLSTTDSTIGSRCMPVCTTNTSCPTGTKCYNFNSQLACFP